jgi:hypothetical protein
VISTRGLSRVELLRRGAGGGAILAVSGAGLGAFAGAAGAAVPDVDLSYLRLLVGSELLKGDFESRALRSGKLASPRRAVLRRMREADAAHYKGLAGLLNGAGQAPAVAGDIDFSYPPGSFASRETIAKLAWRLVALTLGAYLGAVENVQTPQLRLPLGQIAANEAQQLSALAPFSHKAVVGSAFATVLSIDAVSSALDEYES